MSKSIEQQRASGSLPGRASEPPAEALLQCVGISKRYPHFQLHPVDLELPAGMVMGLIGPNGAGKSTLMRIMMGLVNPAAGSVRVLGQPMSSKAAAIKQDVGYFSDDLRLYKGESLGWHMQWLRSMYPTWDPDYAGQLLSRFGLLETQRIKGLSHGQRVKAMMLLILARRPKLLILDEPTNGLDPVAKQEVLSELMQVMKDGERSIIYSSHQTQDVEQISDWLTFIDRGRVIASDNRDDFLDRWRRVKLRTPADWPMPDLPGFRLESQLHNFRVVTIDGFDSSAAELLAQSGAELEVSQPMTLEEIFIEVVMRNRLEESPQSFVNA